MKNKLISIVAPMYNEEEVLGIFFSRIREVFDTVKRFDYEIICINDGSEDNTLKELKKFSNQDNRIKVINLSKNCGKEIALTAGLDHVHGDATIPMDCDLQDPPEVIVSMLEKWEEGYQVVLAKRADRSSDSFIKRTTSSTFYKLIDLISDIHIPENVGDFRLLDRSALNAIQEYRENSRFMKGLFASIGFREATIEYSREPRAAGTTKWNYFKLYKLALEGIISFTSFPLLIWSYLGAIVAFSAFSYGIFLIARTLIYGIDSPGYASIMVVLLFMSGLILLCLGVIGEYLSRIFIQGEIVNIY